MAFIDFLYLSVGHADPCVSVYLSPLNPIPTVIWKVHLPRQDGTILKKQKQANHTLGFNSDERLAIPP